MKKRKTRTRISRLPRRTALAGIGALLFTAIASVSPAQTANAKKKEAPYAVIAGTVFRDPGFSQAGAAVTLTRKDDPKHKKLHEAVSDSRGEFAFRVPPTQATYVVHATLKGYRPVDQDVEISGEVQVNATLVLVPESK